MPGRSTREMSLVVEDLPLFSPPSRRGSCPRLVAAAGQGIKQGGLAAVLACLQGANVDFMLLFLPLFLGRGATPSQ